MKRAGIASIALAVLASALGAQTYRLALYDLPTTAFYRDLFVEIGRTAGIAFDIQVLPPFRADFLVSSGQVDLQAPHLKPKDPAALKDLGFDFGREVIAFHSFVLFSSKAKAVSVSELKRGNPRKLAIETDPANLAFYGFAALPSAGVEASLKKLSSGAIDGYIHSQTTADPYAKRLSLEGCRRSLFDIYDGCYTLPKGKGGGELDRRVAEAILKLKASGKYARIMGKLNAAAVYNDWQP